MKTLDNDIFIILETSGIYPTVFYIYIQNQFSAVISRQLLGLKDNIYITETKRSQFHFLPLPKVTTKGKMNFAFKLVPFYTI